MTANFTDSTVRGPTSKGPAIVSTVFLLLAALADWPYGFFVVLRLVVFGSAIYLAVQAAAIRNERWAWILIGTALLFNPFFPGSIVREGWQVLDLIVAVIFLSSLKGNAPGRHRGVRLTRSSSNSESIKDIGICLFLGLCLIVQELGLIMLIYAAIVGIAWWNWSKKKTLAARMTLWSCLFILLLFVGVSLAEFGLNWNEGVVRVVFVCTVLFVGSNVYGNLKEDFKSSEVDG